MIIVDTNVISEMMRQQPDPNVVDWFNGLEATDLWTTTITTMEIAYGITLMDEGRRRTLLALACEQMMARLFGERVITFDRDAAQRAAARQAQCKRNGWAAALHDSMIAGVVLSRGATLATRNIRHFSGMGIRLVNPFEAGQKQ